MIIYVDRLKDGQVEAVDETLPPTFLEIDEEDLVFAKEVRIHGEAYLAEDHLVINLKVETFASMPCQICNKSTEFLLQVKDFTHTEELKEIKSALYDCGQLLREAILLQVPLFIECQKNSCPERKNVNKFLHKPSDSVYFPFADLDKE